MRIKVRPADTKFSLYIRELRGWRCEKCGRLGRTSSGEQLFKMEASHYWSRSHESTRFDPDNVRCLCFLCHQRMGGYRSDEQGEYDVWMKQLLGEKKYKLLKIRANTYHKKDDASVLLWLALVKKGMNDDTGHNQRRAARAA